MNQTIIRNIFSLVFPKIGLGPPNHPFVHRVFHEINHPFGGYFLPCYFHVTFLPFTKVSSWSPPQNSWSPTPLPQMQLENHGDVHTYVLTRLQKHSFAAKNKPEMLKDSNRTCKTCWFVFWWFLFVCLVGLFVLEMFVCFLMIVLTHWHTVTLVDQSSSRHVWLIGNKPPLLMAEILHQFLGSLSHYL